MLTSLGGLPRINRFVQLCIAVVVITSLSWIFLHNPALSATIQQQVPYYKGNKISPRHHPIDDLVERAEQELVDLLAKETHDVQSANDAYLSRRGRRPPPGFGDWFRFAQDKKAVIVEEFFDRIYHDLNPFWAITASEMRRQASAWRFRVTIRAGKAGAVGDEVERPWLDLWQDLVGTVAENLPDLDIPINEMDESRVVVPWETINENMAVASRAQRVVSASDAVTTYARTTLDRDTDTAPFDFAFSSEGPYWELAVVGCPPNSPARSDYTPRYDYSIPPVLPTLQPRNSYQGFVQNWTLTKSPCDNPSLQALHGTFVEPLTTSNSKKLFPMFGGSKLPMNNEILLPPAMYWTTDPFYSGGQGHGKAWTQKYDKLIWRGAASGGRNRKENWTRFQRHRFVAMMNGTTVRDAELSNTLPPNFDIPSYGAYHLESMRTGFVGDWLKKVADAAFVHLLCFPDPEPPFCPYTNPWYSVGESIPMKEQYAYKYLADIDGNSFSGRYRGFLGSTSLPIKATIYDEWHDSRLVPWKHFVPMDNTFVDAYGILEYFLGAGKVDGHDGVARNISLGGKEWAEKVLRKEDMQVYVYRLLLEYARLCDDNREVLAWISPHEGHTT